MMKTLILFLCLCAFYVSCAQYPIIKQPCIIPYDSTTINNNDKEVTWKVNLGNKINSEYAEIKPVLSPDGKTLYFTRMYHPSNQYGINDPGDVWVSSKNDDGSWTEAVNLGSPVNNNGTNCALSITPDGNTMLLKGIYQGDKVSGDGFSITRKDGDSWGKPDPLKIKNFKNNEFIADNSFHENDRGKRGKALGGCLSNDGKTLVMYFNGDYTYGGLDLYVSFLNDDNTWSKPQNLGPEINTNLHECSPYLASDGKTLYFTSLGHCGYGGYDIFMSKRLDDSWNHWSKPVNMGPIINSPGSEEEFTMAASSNEIYVTSDNHSLGMYDIFRIDVPKEVKPEPVIMVYGRVIDDATGNVVSSVIHYERLSDGKEIGIARSNPQSGEYKITLPKGERYGVRAEADGYYAINDNIDASSLTSYTEIERNITLKQIVKGQIIRLNNIFFDFNKSVLREESYPELNRLLNLMKENPKLKIKIKGHTDNIGNAKYNVELSERRAKAVADYLTTGKIDIDRIEYKGYGIIAPVSDNDTEAGRQANRRVEFEILDY